MNADEKIDGIIKCLSDECERLKKENTLLKNKLSVAIEGLEVLFSDGNINSIPEKTLEAIKSFEELPQDKAIEQDNKEE
tara:strand:+ start:86 stop:322 length:237 start_codon:yes stop_codon:yes gene_type:complete